MAKRKKQSGEARLKRILGIVTFLVALVILVSLITHSPLDDARITGQVDSHLNPFELQFRNQTGMLGAYISYALTVLLGWLAFFLPVGLILVSLRLFSSELGARFELSGSVLFGIAFLVTVLYNVHLLVPATIGHETGAIGGYLGTQTTQLCLKLVGESGSYIIVSGLVAILLVAFTPIMGLFSFKFRFPGFSWAAAPASASFGALKRFFAFEWLKSRASKQGDSEDEEPRREPVHVVVATEPDSEEEPDEPETDGVSGDEDPAPKPRKRATLKRAAEPVKIKSVAYNYPTLDLLAEPPHESTTVSRDELAMTARMLKETLETFQVTIDGNIDTYPGPVITRFEFKPGTGVKVNRILGLADDLALALKAKRIRIVAPIPGKAAVGVEIPNRNPQMVFLRDILNSDAYNNSRIILPLALGKTISGKPFVADLARMPHLLIAGATGSGKSVCMNALITSLMYKLHPLHVRFVFIDPKMLELSVYKGIPHLGRPVVTSPKRAEKVLTDIVVEMERRYRQLAEASVRNIEDYNKRREREEDKLPYIVVCVDELADLMMSATSSKVETLITRLAQMARAVGIHLILATQRPSVDVITGLIKANFPARIAFQVASKVDSRTIIDANGAEKLLGSGDMLFLSTGQPEPMRLHGAYLSSEETERIVKFITDQGLEMMALEGISQASGDQTETEVDLGDPLFREACEVVIRHKQGSVSLLQRRLGIGYQRAARLIDRLEQAGVVSPFDGSKAREVLVDQAYLETMLTASPSGVSDQSQ